MLKLSLVMLGVSGLIFGSFSASNSYRLQNYGINSGGSNTAASPTYRLNGSAGEVNGTPTTGGPDTTKSGAVQAQQANTPAAPTLSNGTNTYYNKLGVVINKGGSDASDYTYAIAASTTGFFTTFYVQADGTLGSSAVFRSYAAWGGASGTFMVGLTPNATYQVKVSAMQGAFTQSPYGAIASVATVKPALSFAVTPNTLAMGSLLAGSIQTSNHISISYDSNSANGGNVYIGGQNSGLKSAANGYTIAALSGDLSTQTNGFGVIINSVGQGSGGPFAAVSPYNGTGTNVGIETSTFRPIITSSTAVTGGVSTIDLKAKAAVTTPAGNDYQEVLTFIASASF